MLSTSALPLHLLEFCYPFAIFDVIIFFSFLITHSISYSKEPTRKTNSHNNKKRVAGIARMCADMINKRKTKDSNHIIIRVGAYNSKKQIAFKSK